MRTSNPALRESVVKSSTRVANPADAMTVDGTLTKVSILLMVVTASAALSWGQVTGAELANAKLWMYGGMIPAFILTLIMSFKPATAPKLAIPFALCEGLFLGAISAVYQYAFYDNIVVYATMLTFGVSFSMFTLWRTGIIKVTDRMRSIVFSAMGAIFLVYMATFVLGFFGISIPMIHGSGIVGIGFSLVVIGVVSFMLTIDFDMIQRMSQGGAPKAMEWYGAFALLVTLVWLYLEMLRLLAKLNSRD
ncbi:MAG: Bax inhibitor-1/YccA family protein [Planctomycetota bacterium]|nr:Bax inhibitor-1/YccA family protein [Planctomycetota bacterium]